MSVSLHNLRITTTLSFHATTAAAANHQPKPWSPTDLQLDQRRESQLTDAITACINNLQTSQFYKLFLHQIRNSQVADHLSTAMNSSSKMHMVIYGIGSIESAESPRQQLSLALLMKQDLDWISDIQIFDPILSATEVRVLESLGCSVLTVNEYGGREACEPTLFFMPGCPYLLYDNLLKANWRGDRLRKMAVFGNSFESYSRTLPLLSEDAKFMAEALKFTREFRVEGNSERGFKACHWLFFSPKPEDLLGANLINSTRVNIVQHEILELYLPRNIRIRLRSDRLIV